MIEILKKERKPYYERGDPYSKRGITREQIYSMTSKEGLILSAFYERSCSKADKIDQIKIVNEREKKD